MYNKKNTKAFFYVFLLCLFLIIKLYRDVMGGTTSQGGVWNVLQLLFVAVGIVLLFSKYPLKATNCSISAINIFIAFSFYTLFLSILSVPNISISTVFSLITMPYGALVLLTSYCYGKNNLIDNNKHFWLLVLTFLILSAIFSKGMINYRFAIFDDLSLTASVYYILCIFPLVLAFLPKIFKPFSFLVVAAVLILSNKRAGMIAFAISILVYYWGGKHKGRNLILLFGIICLTIAILFFLDNYVELTTIDRILSLSEDGGSGRDEKWLNCIQAIGNSNTLNLLFGHGMSSSYINLGGAVHNDFLSVLYEYGIFAFVLYFVFYVKLFIVWIKMHSNHYKYEKEYLMTWIFSLFIAMFSFFIVEPTFITASMFCFGVFMADWNCSKLRITC